MVPALCLSKSVAREWSRAALHALRPTERVRRLRTRAGSFAAKHMRKIISAWTKKWLPWNTHWSLARVEFGVLLTVRHLRPERKLHLLFFRSIVIVSIHC